MTNTNVLELHNVLLGLKGLKGIKFNYAISKNKALLDAEVKSIHSALDMSDEYKAFEEKRIELAKEYAKRDDTNTPLEERNPQTGQTKFIMKDQQAFDVAFKVLSDENKELVDARKKQIEDFNLFLDKENELSLYKIKLEEIPEDITTEQMVGIYPLIEE